MGQAAQREAMDSLSRTSYGPPSRKATATRSGIQQKKASIPNRPAICEAASCVTSHAGSSLMQTVAG